MQVERVVGVYCKGSEITPVICAFSRVLEAGTRVIPPKNRCDQK